MPYRFPGNRRRLLGPLLLFLALPTLGQEQIRVEVTGVNEAVAGNVRAHLNLERLSCGISELHLRNVLSGVDEQIYQALRALGYYQAEWEIQRDPEAAGDARCRITIAIDPGAATTIARLRAELTGTGADNPALASALAQIPLEKGDRVHHGRYEQAKKSLRQTALSLGYFDSRFTRSRLAVDRGANSAAVELVFDTGPRYSFGDISIAETPLDTGFIEKYLTFASGDPFEANKLIRLQNNLINSQYFDQVYVNQGEPDPETHTVDIALELTAKSRYESIFGVGYSTDLGPRVNYQLRNRRFNDEGDTYQLLAQFSPVQSQLGFQFVQPGADPINEKTMWSLGWQNEDTETYVADSYTAEVSRIKVLDNGWARTASLNLLVEDFTVGSDSEQAMVFYPGLHWQKTSANDPTYPTRGWRFNGGIRAAVEDVLSDTSFAQAQVGAKFIMPLLGGRLISRAGLGATVIDDFSQMPASLRFFAGGDNSVRGFEYESLGPTDDNGEVIGGKHLVTGSLEYDHKVYKDYSLAVFYDVGNAFADDQFELYESIGFGARWHSPIGTIRVDLAFPVESSGVQFHISMGPDL